MTNTICIEIGYTNIKYFDANQFQILKANSTNLKNILNKYKKTKFIISCVNFNRFKLDKFLANNQLINDNCFEFVNIDYLLNYIHLNKHINSKEIGIDIVLQSLFNPENFNKYCVISFGSAITTTFIQNNTIESVSINLGVKYAIKTMDKIFKFGEHVGLRSEYAINTIQCIELGNFFYIYGLISSIKSFYNLDDSQIILCGNYLNNIDIYQIKKHFSIKYINFNLALDMLKKIYQ